MKAQSSQGQCTEGNYCKGPGIHPNKLFNCMQLFSQADKPISPLIVLLETLRLVEHIPGSFTAFRIRAMEPAFLSRTVGLRDNRKPVWLVPLPLWIWTGNRRPGPQQRRRLLQAKFFLLQRTICFLNWITVGYLDRPVPEAQAGEPLSYAQYEAVENLLAQINHFVERPAFQTADAGRFGEKFNALRSSLLELPQHADVDPSELLQQIKVELDSYAKYEQPHFVAHDDHVAERQSCDHSPSQVVVKDLGHKPVIASRIKWKHPPTFDPQPYLLDPVVSAVYREPDTLRPPESLWPDRTRARVQCSRCELLKLMKVWDAHRSLALFPCREVEPHETVGIFAVPKDQSYDRLIANPTVLNSRMMPYSSYTKRLAPGSLLTLLSLEPRQAPRYCADDLSDFHYTFKVSRQRAKRNCIGTKVYASELQDFECYDPSIPGPFYPALATLAMGDGHAVEVAQGARRALLQVEAGCMRDGETLEYRRPIPRGNFVETLAVDDDIGIQRVNLHDVSSKHPARDAQVFDAANDAYKKVGLNAHPGKAKRCETSGTLRGADFDGIKGRVSAPRTRILLLMWLTALVAKPGACTRQILSSLLGCCGFMWYCFVGPY